MNVSLGAAEAYKNNSLETKWDEFRKCKKLLELTPSYEDAWLEIARRLRELRKELDKLLYS